MDILVLTHDCFKIHGYAQLRLYCQQQRCRLLSVVSGDIRLMPIFIGIRSFAGDVVSNESAVVENATFLCRSLNLSHYVLHWFTY